MRNAIAVVVTTILSILIFGGYLIYCADQQSQRDEDCQMMYETNIDQYWIDCLY